MRALLLGAAARAAAGGSVSVSPGQSGCVDGEGGRPSRVQRWGRPSRIQRFRWGLELPPRANAVKVALAPPPPQGGFTTAELVDHAQTSVHTLWLCFQPGHFTKDTAASGSLPPHYAHIARSHSHSWARGPV